MRRKTATDFDPQVLALFDRYVHGGLSRRGFLQRASRLVAGTVAAAALLEALKPDYARARAVDPDDPRIVTDRIAYTSPEGHGVIKGLLAHPVAPATRRGGVVVVHENRGLNPYIEDVARRVALAGFTALAPDGLTSLGGYPGNDDDGRQMQRTLDRGKLLEDFIAAFHHLRARDDANGKVGVVGFCFGGSISNAMAVRLPDLAAAVPFYGGQPAVEDVPHIKAPLLLHFAGLDTRVNKGWPAYEAALKAAARDYTAHTYDDVSHGFHNDTTPRYDKAAATLAWERTILFFRERLA